MNEAHRVLLTRRRRIGGVDAARQVPRAGRRSTCRVAARRRAARGVGWMKRIGSGSRAAAASAADTPRASWPSAAGRRRATCGHW